MDEFFYARIAGFEVQVYSDSPEAASREAVIYLGLEDQAYPRAELWFVARDERDMPDNEIAVSGTSGESSFLAYFRLEKLPLIVDLLRGDDNVWFTWDGARVAAIRVGRRPVTEADRSSG